MNKTIVSLTSLAVSLALPAAVIAQTPTPTISSITPSEAQTIYGNKIPVLIAYENFTLADSAVNTINKPGEGHIHLWMDEASPTGENAVKLMEETFTYSDVAYGEHTLVAELVNNNHTSLVPPQKVTVNFKNAPVGSPSPTVKSGIDKSTALVIFIVVALVIVAAWWYTKEEDEEEEISQSEKPKSKATRKKTVKKKAPKKRR